MLHHKVLESVVYNGIDCPRMVVLESSVCYMNLLVLVVLAVGVTSFSADGMCELVFSSAYAGCST